MKTRKHKQIYTRQMKNFNEEAFLRDLSAYNWSSILYCSEDINVVVEKWISMLSLIIETHAPMMQKRVSERYSPWMSSSLKDLLRSRDKLKVAAVKAKSEILMAAYRQVRNKANRMNADLKKTYFTNKIHEAEGNVKETWSTINKLINKRSKTTTIQSLRVDGITIFDSKEIANSMNQFFCTVGEKLSNDIPETGNPLLNDEYIVNPQNATFSFAPVTPKQLIETMGKFRTSQGSGLDCISSFFLKVGMPVLAGSLSRLFNMSMSLGIFPDDWKIARVAPIYKDGSEDENSNYRPISVLPVISRLFEKLVYDQFYGFLNVNKLLFSQQSSFRLLHSVLTCLLKCTNDWYLNLENSEYTAVTFIDLKKAFDTVNHDILIQKLEHYGVQNKEIRWFRSYLTNRKQCCKVNGQLSDLESITTGVPQGSCLGPLLFIIYVNDLHFSLRHSDVNMYADDTSLSFSSKSIQLINECVNEDLGYLKSWLNANKLSLNVTKTQSLVIGGSKRLNDLEKVGGVKPQFNVGEETVSIIRKAKYLGVMVDQHLNWKEQITTIKKKVSRGIGMLKYSKKFLPLLTIQSMYKSLVEPYLRYCCPVWGSCGSTAINELQKLQNRAARIVTNSRYDASAKPIIKKLGWHTVSEMIQMETLSMVYKSINDLAPTYLTEMFSRLSDSSKRELRNTRSDLEIPMRKSANGQKCFSYKGATMWNRLSQESKLSPTLKTFKKSIANHAFN